MEKKLVIVLLAMSLFLISFSSASMTISDVNSVYNIGDKIYISVELVPGNVEGNFEINLNCGGSIVNFYKVPAEASFAAGEQQKVATYVPLMEKFIGNLSGSCFIEASLGDEKIQTKTFTISDSIIVNAKLDKQKYNPGETITLTVDATKANGALLEGFLDVSGSMNFSRAVSKGQLVEKFAFPSTASPGPYTLNIDVYDKKDTEILNSGTATLSLTINQVPTSLDLSIDKTEVIPGDSLTLGADLYDQAGQKIDSEVSVKIISPLNEEFDLNFKTGSFEEYKFPFNATSGEWKVFASSLGVNSEKDFKIDELQKVSFDFVNGTSILDIKNIGNAVYNKIINITIGTETRTLELLNIAQGEERKFTLNAPNGQYNINVDDGVDKITGSMLLTGNAISVKDFTGIGLFSRYPIVWVFIIIILGAFAAVFLIKYFRKKTFKHGSLLDSKKLFPASKKASEMRENFINVSNKIDGAESSIVLKGDRVNSSVVAVKFSSGQNARQEMNRILAKAKLRKGVVEWDSNHVLIIFSPLVTKASDNEWLAARTGYEISRELIDYNKGHVDKAVFGIGVHSGDLIASIENGKFKYTSVGGTIMAAKKLADSAKEKVLITEDARKKVMKDLRVQKISDAGKRVIYEITGITDREANQGKLDDLLKRIGR